MMYEGPFNDSETDVAMERYVSYRQKKTCICG